MVRQLCLLTIAGILVLVIPNRAHAQGLDIGGIQIQIGQPIGDALTRLRAVYDVQFSDSVKRWFVTRKNGNQAVQLGNIEVSSDRITMIQKAYNYDNDMLRLSETYGLALRDAERLGGRVCEAALKMWPDGTVQSVISTCGRYVVSWSLPFKTADGTGVVNAGLSVIVH